MKCKKCGYEKEHHPVWIDRFIDCKEFIPEENRAKHLNSRENTSFMKETDRAKTKRCGKFFHFNHPIYGWIHLDCGKWKEIKPNVMTMELCPSCLNHSPLDSPPLDKEPSDGLSRKSGSVDNGTTTGGSAFNLSEKILCLCGIYIKDECLDPKPTYLYLEDFKEFMKNLKEQEVEWEDLGISYVQALALCQRINEHAEKLAGKNLI